MPCKHTTGSACLLAQPGGRLATRRPLPAPTINRAPSQPVIRCTALACSLTCSGLPPSFSAGHGIFVYRDASRPSIPQALES